MMNNQQAPQKSKQEDNPIQALAAQFEMTQEETRSVINIVQEKDPPLESLKQPRVLMLIKQRKGRWVKEEEDFASFLSEEFLLGISDIDNGTTRRAYLSSKLACTKMRISKKFKGQSTGKEVFTRRERKPNGRILSPQEIHFYKRMHVELEKKFIKSVLKTFIRGSLRNAQKKKPTQLHLPPPGMQSTANNIQMPNSSFTRGSAETSPTNDTGCIQKSGSDEPRQLKILPGFGQLNHEFQSGFTSSVNSASATQLKGPTIMERPAFSNQKAKVSVLPSQTAAITNPTQAFPIQLNSMTAVQVPSGVPIKMCTFNHNGIHLDDFAEIQARKEAQHFFQFPPFIDNNQNMRGNQGHNKDTDGLKKRPVCDLASSMVHTFPLLPNTETIKRFKPIPTATASQAVSTSASEPSSNDESENIPSSIEASCHSNGTSTWGIAKPENHYSHSDIPDLLSGFDKHVASMKEAATAATTGSTNRPIPEDSHLFAGAGGIGESPYVTSKSFDELHKFLGKGLSTENLYRATNQKPSAKKSATDTHASGRKEMSFLDLNQSGNHLAYQNTHQRSASAPVPRQIGPPLSVGAFFSQFTQVPGAVHAQPHFNVQGHFNRPSSTSNNSDLTASD